MVVIPSLCDRDVSKPPNYREGSRGRLVRYYLSFFSLSSSSSSAVGGAHIFLAADPSSGAKKPSSSGPRSRKCLRPHLGTKLDRYIYPKQEKGGVIYKLGIGPGEECVVAVVCKPAASDQTASSHDPRSRPAAYYQAAFARDRD